jgi:hypothetical protein
MSNGTDEERETPPWYAAPSEAPVIEQPQTQPVSVGRSADEIAESNYLSPRGSDEGAFYPSEGAGASLLSTLGGGGAAPAPAGGSALMLPMLLAQMQQRQQASPLDAFTRAYANANAMLHGRPLPEQQGPKGPSQYEQFQMIHSVLKDQALEQERSARLTMAQRAQDRLDAKVTDDKLRRDEDLYRKDADFQITEGRRQIGSDDPTTRALGASNYLAGLKKRGYQVGDNEAAVFDSLARGDISHKQMGELVKDMSIGIPDDALLARRGVTPELLAGLRVKGGPVEQLMGANQLKLRTDTAKANKEEADAINAQNPEFAKEPKLIPFIMDRSKSLYGVPYQKLTDDQKAGVMKMAQTDANADALNEYKKHQQVMLQREQAMAGTHFGYQVKLAQVEQKGIFAPIGTDTKNIWVDRTTGKPAQGDALYMTGQEAFQKGLVPLSEKQVNVQNAFTRGMAMFENIKATSDEMEKRGLYSGTWARGPLGVGAVAENIYKGQVLPKIGMTDSDRALLRNFEAQKTELLGIDRALNSFGVRAFGAFGPQLNILSPTTGPEGVKLTMSQLESAFKEQYKLQKLPGVFPGAERQIWAPPTLGKGIQAPAQGATTGMERRPLSQMDYDIAVQNLRTEPGMTPERLQREIDNLGRKFRIVGGGS